MVVSHSVTKHNDCYRRWDMCPLCNLGSKIVSDAEQKETEDKILEKYGFPASYYDAEHNHMNEKRKWWQFRPIRALKKFLFMLDFEKNKKRYQEAKNELEQIKKK